MKSIAEIRSLIRKHDWLALLRKSVRAFIYRKDIELLFVKNLVDGKQRFGRGSNISRLLRFPDDLEILRRSSPSRGRAFPRWSRDGVIVAGAIADDRVVAVQAYVSGMYHEPILNYTFHHAPQEWYMFAGWSHPDWRGKSSTSAILDLGLTEMRARGGTRCFTLTKTTNVPAQKVLLHLGFEECGTKLMIRRFLGLTWTITKEYRGTLMSPEALSRRLRQSPPSEKHTT